MKFCCNGAQLYMVGIGLTALMILMGIDWIFPSLSLASARRMNCECDGGSSEQTLENGDNLSLLLGKNY